MEEKRKKKWKRNRGGKKPKEKQKDGHGKPQLEQQQQQQQQSPVQSRDSGGLDRTMVVDVIGTDDTRTVDVVGSGSGVSKLLKDATGAAGVDISPRNETTEEIDIEGEAADSPGSLQGRRFPGKVLSDGLESIHSEITSPIGNARQVFENSYFDVQGDDSLRGDGTPPGTSVGAPVYTLSRRELEREERLLLLKEREIKRRREELVNRLKTVEAEFANIDERAPLRTSEKSGYATYSDSRIAPEELHVSIVEGLKGTQSKSPRKKRKRGDARNGDSGGVFSVYRLWSTGFKVWFLTVISFWMNIFLFSMKIYVSVRSHSLAVIASAVDSLLDLISQAIIYFALQGTSVVDEENWPVGRSRLEPVSIILCAALMGVASLQIIYHSVVVLVSSIVSHKRPDLSMDDATVILLASAIAIKTGLFILCLSLRHKSHSIMALAEDHRNDVVSNSGALLTAYLAHRFPAAWWLDPSGAILISLWICIMWIYVAKDQIEMLVGRTAAPEFLKQVRELANDHHENMLVDVVRAYHFGKRYLVEIEVVLPRRMPVEEAHDISIELQKRVEGLRQVERAFVHVDYMTRDENEHKIAHLHTPPSTPPVHPEDYVTTSEDEDEIQIRHHTLDPVARTYKEHQIGSSARIREDEEGQYHRQTTPAHEPYHPNYPKRTGR